MYSVSSAVPAWGLLTEGCLVGVRPSWRPRAVRSGGGPRAKTRDFASDQGAEPAWPPKPWQRWETDLLIVVRIRQARADAKRPLADRSSRSDRRRGVRLLLVGLATMALALPVAPLAGEEPVRIDRVVISGNHRVEEEAIRVRLNSKPGTIFSAETVDADVRELYEMRFFDDIEVGLADVDGAWVLTYHVTERPFPSRYPDRWGRRDRRRRDRRHGAGAPAYHLGPRKGAAGH